MPSNSTPTILTYRKVRSREILDSLENIVGLSSAQVFCPLHTRLFALTPTTANAVTIDSPSRVATIKNQTGENTFAITTTSANSEADKETESFVKFSPLLDPLKHVTCGYSPSDLTSLPSYTDSSVGNPKLTRPDNSSYIDAATSALCAALHSVSGMPNLVEFYGYFLGVKQNYRYMITDDLDIALDSQHFSDNLGGKFKLEGHIPRRTDSLSYKPALRIGSPAQLVGVEQSVANTEVFICPRMSHSASLDRKPLILDNMDTDDSEISGTESSTDDEETSVSSESNSIGESDSEHSGSICSCEHSSSSCTEDEEEDTYCRMDKFPCSAIFLEKLDDTLESLTADEDLSDTEWSSALFQVTITLAYLQRTINFTHNDLHTSNIMYKHTDQKWIHYKLGGIYYKVPTFGRIFKIIDFGRSIFDYHGQRFASDSFQKGEDAAGQYNCTPFLNPNKPELLPNRSFDLCRLGCSLFDYFFQNVRESQEDELSPLEALIVKWCTDSSGKNLLYKSNGEDRYPGFKLYRMIARRASNLEPERMLCNEVVFTQFTTTRKRIANRRIFDLDAGPYLSCSVKSRNPVHS